MKHLNIKVFGQVQGVAFRYYAKQQADNLALKGFAKNQPDGTVYIEAEGEKETLDQFLNWCKKGPEFAKVTKVEATSGEIKKFNKFLIN